ncbi:MAG: hypothetical protein J07HQX50_01981 [Haloquadratum sp. J07HQX50]|nr:MAG: hypothetical protein J07HQX50_01981 [Haloquadratum sp. J07HQX50]
MLGADRAVSAGRLKIADFRGHENLRFTDNSLSEGEGAERLHSAQIRIY